MSRLQGGAVVISDARGPVGAALVRSLIDAQVERIYIGAGDAHHPTVVRSAFDVREPASLAEAARRMAEVGVVIDTTSSASAPGTAVGSGRLDLLTAEFDAVALGLARMAAAFVPVLARRRSSSFVALVSVQAWANVSGPTGVAQAARLSLLDALRLEVVHAGIRVLGAMTECEGDPLMVTSGTSPEDIAGLLVNAIEAGEFEVLLDDQARRVKQRLCGPIVALFPELA